MKLSNPKFLASLALILFILAMLGSPSFQDCANRAYASQVDQTGSSSFFSVVNIALNWTRLTCVGNFIHDAHNEILAVFTVLLAFFTLALYASTKQTIRTMEDTARKELRAYVALDDIYFRWKRSNALDPYDRSDIVKSDPPQRPRIRVKNFGKTPASHMSIRSNGLMTKISEPIEQRYVGRKYAAPKHTLFPTQEFGTWTIELKPAFDPHNVSYDPSKLALAIFGAITYEDIYRRW